MTHGFGLRGSALEAQLRVSVVFPQRKLLLADEAFLLVPAEHETESSELQMNS